MTTSEGYIAQAGLCQIRPQEAPSSRSIATLKHQSVEVCTDVVLSLTMHEVALELTHRYLSGYFSQRPATRVTWSIQSRAHTCHKYLLDREI